MRFPSDSTISPSNSIFSSFSAITTPWSTSNTDDLGRPPSSGGQPPGLGDRGDVRRLGALRALPLFERDARALSERLVTVAGDLRVMDEEILRPLVGVMNPYPFASLNHFTVPLAIKHLLTY